MLNARLDLFIGTARVATVRLVEKCSLLKQKK